MRQSFCIIFLWLLGLSIQMGRAVAQEGLFAKEICTAKFNFGFPTKIDEDKIGRIWVLSNGKLSFVQDNERYAIDYLNNSRNEDVQNFFVNDDDLIIHFKSKKLASFNLMSNTYKILASGKNVDSIMNGNAEWQYIKNDEFYNQNDRKGDKIKAIEKAFEIDQNLVLGNIDKKQYLLHIKDKVLENWREVPSSNKYNYFHLNGNIYKVEPREDHVKVLLNKDIGEGQIRSSYPLDNETILVATEKNNKLLVFRKNEYIDVIKLVNNAAYKKYFADAFILHTSAYDADHVILLDNKYKTFLLNKTTLTIKAFDNINKLKLDLKNICTTKNGEIWIGTYSSSVLQYNIKEQKAVIHNQNNGLDLQDVFRIYEDDKGNVWLGNLKGVSIYNNQKKSFFNIRNEYVISNVHLLNTAFTAFSHHENRIFIGTYQQGLFEVNYAHVDSMFVNNIRNNFQLKMLSFVDNNILSTKGINYLNKYENGYLIRTNSHLIYYNLEKNAFRLIQEFEYLPNVMLNNYNYIVNENYLCGVVGGCAIININEAVKTDYRTSLMSIYKDDELLKNNYSFILNKRIEIKNDFDYLRIVPNFSLSYDIPNGASYKSKESDDWNFIRNNEIIYVNRNQNANLDILSKYHYKDDKNSQYNLHISVTDIWYKSWWAKVLLFSAFIMLLAASIYYYFRANKYANQFSKLELDALRSQMNPHFISNALNSINYYILENKADLASNTLVKFSRLMRKILDSSLKEMNSIADELNIVQMYMDIEKQRIKDKFSFAIIVDSDVDLDYQIPAAILQPIVENAIWHGINERLEGGHVGVYVKRQNEAFMIEIIDNGIGISNSLKKKSNGVMKNSISQNIVKRRLELLNFSSKKKYKIALENVIESNKEFPGTKISLTV